MIAADNMKVTIDNKLVTTGKMLVAACNIAIRDGNSKSCELIYII